MPIATWGANPPAEIDQGFDWAFTVWWAAADGSAISPDGWAAEALWEPEGPQDLTASPQIVVDASHKLDNGDGTFTVTITLDQTYTAALALSQAKLRIAVHGPNGEDDLLLAVPVKLNRGRS